MLCTSHENIMYVKQTLKSESQFHYSLVSNEIQSLLLYFTSVPVQHDRLPVTGNFQLFT